MTFDTYQEQAQKTDRIPLQERVNDPEGITIPLLGLASEVGGLLAEYKKRLRDGDAHKLFPDLLKEELGDAMWYMANTASRLGFSLNEIADRNLKKVGERWSDRDTSRTLFDGSFPAQEQIPRVFTADFLEKDGKVTVTVGSEKIGDYLTDNSYLDDGYRYHDIFHIAHATFLGWSPVLRANMHKKRKSDPKVDEVEDGARARILDETISLFVYTHADDYDFFPTVESISWNLLKSIKSMAGKLEVKRCSTADWQKAIFNGYQVFRQLRDHNGGRVKADLIQKTLTFEVLNGGGK